MVSIADLFGIDPNSNVCSLRPMTRKNGKALYNYTLGFDREQMAQLSKLLACTGLTTAGVLRLGLTTLEMKLYPTPFEVPPAAVQEPSEPIIKKNSTDGDPETEAGF